MTYTNEETSQFDNMTSEEKILHLKSLLKESKRQTEELCVCFKIPPPEATFSSIDLALYWMKP